MRIFASIVGLFAAVITQALCKSAADLVVNKWDSMWALINQVPFESLTVEFTNVSPNNVNAFNLLYPAKMKLVSHSIVDNYGSKLKLLRLPDPVMVSVNNKPSEYSQYQITLHKPLKPGQTLKLPSMSLHFKHNYKFTPSKISIKEEQVVQTEVPEVPCSPYAIERLEVSIEYGDSQESQPKRKQYSSREHIAPLSPETDTLRFALNTHFTQSKLTKRTVEVSHWGNVNYNDEYYLQNRAATFRGEFSTIDYNKGNKLNGRNAFKGYRIELPHNAWGLFYRDEIGNITTSKVKRSVSFLSNRLTI